MSDRFTHARLHALTRILATPTRPFPHRHLHVEEVFPPEFFAELRANMPPADAYTSLAKTGKVKNGDYEMRAGFLLNEEHLSRVPLATADLWTGLFNEVFNQEFVDLVLERFRPEIEARLAKEGASWPEVRRDMILVRDSSSDGVKIHTSDPKNLITFLFYLPQDDRHSGCGTTLYLPKDRDFRCWGGPHHEFEQFDKVWTAPYVPNSLFMFVKTDDTFHGVEPIRIDGLRRDLLLFYIHR